jgi:hypothetical protein
MNMKAMNMKALVFLAPGKIELLEKPGHQIMPGQALAQDDLAPLIHPDTVKDPLCDVDSPYTNMVFHRTRLLWWNGFTGLEIILAH